MRTLLSCFLFLGMLLSTGCATIVSGTKQKVGFVSSPSRATVTINGEEVGKTPYLTKLRRNGRYNVRIELEGFQPYETTIKRRFNFWYLGNIVFGGVIGLIVDPSTGAVYSLSPKAVDTEFDSNTSSKSKRDEIYISVSLKHEENYKKIAQLTRL